MKKKDMEQKEMKIQELLDKAIAANQDGKFTEAQFLYEKLLDLDPENPDALYLLGGIYYRNKNPGLAAELISRAIHSAPERDYFYNHLGLALCAMGDAADALDAFQTALALNPKNPETYNMMGKVLSKTGKISEAIDAFQKAFDLDSENIEACHNLSGILLKHDQPGEAILVLRQFLDKKPDMVETRNRLGKALLFLGKIQEAVEEFRKCIQTDPENVQAYQNLGAAFESAGKQAEAAAAFQKAVLLARDSAEAHHRYGNYLLANKKMAEAIEEFEKAIEKKPAFAEAYNSLGIALKSEGRIEEAIEAYKKAIEIDPKHPQTHNNLGVALSATGKNQEAFKSYQTAISLEPNNPHVFQNIGILFKTRGRLQEALIAFNQAAKLFPGYADAYHNIGTTLIEMGQTSQALSALQKAAQLDPGNHSAKYMAAALAGENPKNAPPEYVKELFNQYSKRFENHLTCKLSYQTPQLLRKALDQSVGKDMKFKHVLDLGCGTGLAGKVFHDIAGYMVGVDISPDMIGVAQQKNIYNQLHVSEINEFLGESSETFDLVIAADVLVYMGDLEPLFSNLKNRITHGGCFVFSTERFREEGYRLRSTGRFAHAGKYIRVLSEKKGFQIIHHSPVVLRKENDKPVEGDIFVLLKKNENKGSA